MTTIPLVGNTITSLNRHPFSAPGHFPPPTTTEELGARILIQERYEKYGESEEVEMEVESEDEDDHRDTRNEGHASQPDQDTQLQDMDEVRAGELYILYFSTISLTCKIN